MLADTSVESSKNKIMIEGAVAERMPEKELRGIK